jgi:hypothetical protein
MRPGSPIRVASPPERSDGHRDRRQRQAPFSIVVVVIVGHGGRVFVFAASTNVTSVSLVRCAVRASVTSVSHAPPTAQKTPKAKRERTLLGRVIDVSEVLREREHGMARG